MLHMMPTAVEITQLNGLQVHTSTSADPAGNLAYETELFATLRLTPTSVLLFYTNSPCIVAGRANDLAEWVHGDTVAADGLPLLRRSSGGGAVYHDLDCLNYCFILPKTIVEGLLRRSPYSAPDPSRYIGLFCGIVVDALAGLGDGFHPSGVSDISYHGQKISGNAQRIASNLVLHHGTLLQRCPLAAYERYLPIPPNRPGIPHRGFVSGLSENGFDTSQAQLRSMLMAQYASRLADFGG
jgi:lipoate---protein ligase